MSHFSVLVIGPYPEKQLAPYHEFECTGLDDEFVVDVDVTKELRQQYEEQTSTRLRATDGSIHSFFDEEGKWRKEFSQVDPNAADWDKDRRTYFVPPGFEKIEVPTSQVESFAEFIESWSGQKIVPPGGEPNLNREHKYGYVLMNGTEVALVIDRTNPNKKWDWFQLGGRYTGRLKLKPGATGTNGKPGLMTERGKPGYTDQAVKCCIDFDAMRDEQEGEARASYRRFFRVLGNNELPKKWSEIRQQFSNDIEEARKAYAEQPGIIAIRKDEEFRWSDDVGEEFSCTEDQYAQRARHRACGAFAVVKDSQWYEKGRMGWWATVSDEKEDDAWYAECARLLDSAADHELISIIDCHI